MNLTKITLKFGEKKAMNNGRWQPHEDKFVRDNVNKMTLEQMSDHLGRSALAVQLYMHRKHIVTGQTVKRNLVQEMLRIKFRHPENFMPTRAFYREVGINQMRWWDIFHGRKNINQTEYIGKTSSYCSPKSKVKSPLVPIEIAPPVPIEIDPQKDFLPL